MELAIEVPESPRYRPYIAVVGMLVPGAARSTNAPVVEKLATRSASSVAETERMYGVSGVGSTQPQLPEGTTTSAPWLNAYSAAARTRRS